MGLGLHAADVLETGCVGDSTGRAEEQSAYAADDVLV